MRLVGSRLVRLVGVAALAGAVSWGALVACTGEDPQFASRDDAGPMLDAPTTDTTSAVDAALPLTADRIEAIAVGSTAACVVTRDDKALWCIGRVEEGENLRPANGSDVACVGNGVSLWRGSPRFERIDVGPVDRVAVSLRARCILQSGKVRCWGGNRVGELGHAPGTAGDVECGTNLTCNTIPQEPTNLPTGATFVEIAAGNRSFCARTSEGSVYCWGDNVSSQTGLPSSPTELPHKIDLGGAQATTIAMGLSTGCAALKPRGVACWGSNSGGVVSTDAGASVATPRLVAAATNIEARELDVNGHGACALSSSAAASPICWGNDANGLLAGSPGPSGARVVGEIPFGGEELGVGEYGAAVLVGTAVWTWGRGLRGGLASDELSDGGPSPPAARASLAGTRLLAFGFEENGMAVRGNELVAWGPNTCGQLGHAPGDGDAVCERSDPCRPSPVVVPLP